MLQKVDKVEVVSDRGKKLFRSVITQEDFEAQLNAALLDFEAHGHDSRLIGRIEAEVDEATGEVCFTFLMKAS